MAARAYFCAFYTFAITLLCSSPLVHAATHSYSEIRKGFKGSESILLDRSGESLHALRSSFEQRRLPWVSLVDISPSLARAIVGAEDRRFFEHNGVDVLAVGGAVRDYLQGKRLRGASTITMQLAALLEPSLLAANGRKSLGQKLDQSQAALEMEETWSKEEILEAYLNLVSFRGELQGVAAASMGLFQKRPANLLRAEALLLASLVRSPNTSAEHLGRRACALTQVLDWSVPCSELKRLSEATLARPYSIPRDRQLAPHLANRLVAGGSTEAPNEPIRTTVDRKLQSFVIGALRNQLAHTKAEHMQDGAVLVLDNKSGDVLAYVGSVGEGSEAPAVDAVRARRQAGSTLKPFLYAHALQRRILTASTVLPDEQLSVPFDQGVYQPSNYDNHFRGDVTVREALASSLNIPAVRTLGLVGVANFARVLRDLGFTMNEDATFYGPALALGSLDVSLWELTNAYRTLANSGEWTPVRLRADSSESMRRRQVFSFGTSFIVSDILADRGSRHRTFGLENVLSTRYWSAVKTGTSQDMRDNWCVGYSDRFTVGVWTGNVSGEPSWNVSGVEGAAPVWTAVMNYLHRSQLDSEKPGSDLPAEELADVLSRKPVKLANAEEMEWYLKGTEPSYTFKVRKSRAWRRIVYPQPGMVIALDPNIPEEKQRILFRSNPKDKRLSWRLNGKALGSAGGPFLWRPEAGTHSLELFDQARSVAIDSVQFQVR